MTVFPNESEAPVPDVGAAKPDDSHARKNQRRKRSFFRTIRRRLDKMLRLRHIIRASAVLLPLAGFLYISFSNFAQSPQGEAPPIIGSTQDATSSKLSTGRYATAMSLSPDGEASYQAGKEPGTSVSTNSVRSVSKAAIHTVNEGGSLWRTARRFITDEVLIDRLIDSLEDNGMDVRRVKAGFEFIVNDLGSEGLLVIVEEDGKTYESRVFADRVTTSVQRQSGNGTDLSRTASLGQ